MKDQENVHKKQVTIIINARSFTVEKDAISFEEVVAVAFPNPPTGENILFTVMYHRGHGDKPEGTLVAGQVVKVKEGMRFDVTPTNKS